MAPGENEFDTPGLHYKKIWHQDVEEWRFGESDTPEEGMETLPLAPHLALHSFSIWLFLSYIFL